jgi:hypothetical protein
MNKLALDEEIRRAVYLLNDRSENIAWRIVSLNLEDGLTLEAITSVHFKTYACNLNVPLAKIVGLSDGGMLDRVYRHAGRALARAVFGI